MKSRCVFIFLAAGALVLPAELRLAAQSDEQEDETEVMRPRGGSTLSGTGAGEGEEDPAPSTNPQNSQQMLGGYLAKTASALDPTAPTPCYDKMPANPKLRGQGRLICWVAHIAPETPPAEETDAGSGDSQGESVPPPADNVRVSGSNNTGTTQGDRALANTAGYTLKHVQQWEDGSFPNGMWYEQAKKAFPAAAQKFYDETGDENILSQQVTGYKSYVTKWFDPGVGAYVDNGAPSPVPDETHWIIEISGGYKWTFDHGNKRDCIYSGNGVAYLSGNGHSIITPANGDHKYKDKIICIRCHSLKHEQ